MSRVAQLYVHIMEAFQRLMTIWMNYLVIPSYLTLKNSVIQGQVLIEILLSLRSR